MRIPFLHSVAASAEQIVDRVLCVGGAVLFSQFPEFMQQYLQRLEGHLDEARLQLAGLKDTAAQSGATIDQLVANAAASSDPLMQRLGILVKGTAGRVDQLAAADDALRHASLVAKPFVFFLHLEPAIARATWSIFRPAVPTTLEGLVYAGVGMLAVLALYHGGVRYPVRRAWEARAAAKKGASPVRSEGSDPGRG